MKIPREMKKAIAKDILLSKKKEVKEKLENANSVKEYCFYEVFKEAIDWAIETFEHDAIPVSWIEEQIKVMKATSNFEESWNYQGLLDDWREEND